MHIILNSQQTQVIKMSAIKNISLYIPHVFPNFDKEYLRNQFSFVGEVSEIDFVAKQDRNGKNYNQVYIHFNNWFDNETSRNLYNNITENGKDHWYHDSSVYYWIVLPNSAKKHIPGERKPRIDLGESNAISTSNVCPVAPKKPTYADAIAKPLDEVKKSLEACFDEAANFEAEIEAEMDEIERCLEEEDANLVKIDGRYVQQLEQDNWAMNMEIAQLRAALINLDQLYQAEAVKVRAFASTSADP